MNTLRINPILAADSYKLSHYPVYPSNVTGMFSYIEPRASASITVVPFGLQMWVKKMLANPITKMDIDEAEAFAAAHGEPFNRKGWEIVVDRYNGFMPLTIRAVPEGTPVPSLNAIVTVECTDPDLFWLTSYIETSLLRAIWYPTTIATNDARTYQMIKRFVETTADDLSGLPFMLHDFGGRGVTCGEQAEIGGAAHLVHFMGSDTIEGIRAANFYYNTPMAAFSVPAMEHSVQCSYGPSAEGQKEYLSTAIAKLAKPGGIVSIVLDGYDVYRETETLCSLKDQIIESGARIVIRPDSGDPLEVIPRLLGTLARSFGVTENSKGYKVINNVGLLQGDGIDYDSIYTILADITNRGYSTSNIVFGSGGALLQKVNRDTFKFAMKASAILQDNKWTPIFKDPVTDPGKKSKAGRVTLLRSKLTGEYLTGNLEGGFNSEWEDAMVLVYDKGQLFNETTLDEIRARALNKE